MITTLETPESFRFPATVQSHGWYLLAPFRWDAGTETLYRAEILADESVDLKIRHQQSELQIESKKLTKKQQQELEPRLRRMFQLHVDLSEFHELCLLSPLHRGAAERGFGRLLCGSTIFEDLVKIILTTNTTWKQTVRTNELLVEQCGMRSSAGTAAFPRPADILRFDPETLQKECRLGYRANYIHELAKGLQDDSIDLNLIADPLQTTDELFRSYRTLPGIGPYAAAHLLAMDGRYDFIAVDTEFRRFVCERYHGGRSVKESTMLNHYSRWGRWKYLGYWAELWDTVREKL